MTLSVLVTPVKYLLKITNLECVCVEMMIWSFSFRLCLLNDLRNSVIAQGSM